MSLEQIPYVQKAIVRRANRWHTPLYVATNLLESMVVYNRPTIAEMNDIANTLLDGAHGLVLAAETAIGVDPVGAVDMVKQAVAVFEQEEFGRRPRRSPAIDLTDRNGGSGDGIAVKVDRLHRRQRSGVARRPPRVA